MHCCITVLCNVWKFVDFYLERAAGWGQVLVEGQEAARSRRLPLCDSLSLDVRLAARCPTPPSRPPSRQSTGKAGVPGHLGRESPPGLTCVSNLWPG